MTRLWMRHEVRETERRAPIVPADVRRLTDAGIELTVEDSPQRAFPIADYVAAGCSVAEAGSWVDAPSDVIVVGLKELPDEPARLVHRHVFFGHAYKGQDGAAELLRRFEAGGGSLLDIEYLVDDNGRRLAAFGYWAGYVGAALAVLRRRGQLTPLEPLSKSALDASLAGGGPLKALVVGALGRCGRGATDALAVAGAATTAWDVEETRNLDKPALLAHDVLVNAVLTSTPVPPFLTPADLDAPGRRLSVVSDVTCDVTSDCNVLPIYDTHTSWQEPARPLRDGLDIIAIDNLPSLLPTEASVAFSAELTPQLALLGASSGAGALAAPWQRCLADFHAAIAKENTDV